MLIVPTGVGLTMTAPVIPGPGQPLAVGLIVKDTETGTMPVLNRIPLILPLPDPRIPVTVAVLLRFQLKVVPATFPVSMIGVI